MVWVEMAHDGVMLSWMKEWPAHSSMHRANASIGSKRLLIFLVKNLRTVGNHLGRSMHLLGKYLVGAVYSTEYVLRQAAPSSDSGYGCGSSCTLFQAYSQSSRGQRRTVVRASRYRMCGTLLANGSTCKASPSSRDLVKWHSTTPH